MTDGVFSPKLRHDVSATGCGDGERDALTAAAALPGTAPTTAEWRLSAYESSVTGGMTSVVALSRTDAWAVGNTQHGQTPVNNPYVLHWTGAKWSAVTIPDSNGFTSAQVAASSASNVWVLGTNFNGLLNQKIFRYDGAHWHTMTVPAGGVDNLMVLSATDAWVTGQVSVVGMSDVDQKGEGVVAAYRWAGTHWTPVIMSHPNMSGWPDIAMVSASNIWIEGFRGASSQVLALHLTGGKWQRVFSPAGDAASPGAVPYGSTGVWMGPWAAWTGRGWINTLPDLPFAGGVIEDVVPIPGASGSRG